MPVVTPYKTIKCGEPSICPEPTTISTKKPQHKWSIIHVLACADSNGDRREAETAESVFGINDPYDAPYSTKDDERDLRIQGKVCSQHLREVG